MAEPRSLRPDAFISHASEDKETFVRPLVEVLSRIGLNVWYDEYALSAGDSLSRSIDRGLSESRFGIVVISPSFISKPWPEYELRGLVAKEIGSEKVILPIWKNISRADVLSFSPPLADKVALKADSGGLNEIALRITRIVRPDIFERLLRLKIWEDSIANGKRELRPVSELVRGPIRHKSLPESYLLRSKIIHNILSDVLSMSLATFINHFRRDVQYHKEIEHWERMAAAYLDVLKMNPMTQEQRKEAFSVIFHCNLGMLSEEKAHSYRHLSYDDVAMIAQRYLEVIPKITDEPEEDTD